MSNLNCDDTQGGTQDGTQDDTQKDMKHQITNLIRNNNKIRTETMAIALGVSVSTIKRRIACIWMKKAVRFQFVICGTKNLKIYRRG